MHDDAACQCQWWMMYNELCGMREGEGWLVERGGRKEDKNVVFGRPCMNLDVGRSSLFHFSSSVSVSKSSLLALLPYNFWWIDRGQMSKGHSFLYWYDAKQFTKWWSAVNVCVKKEWEGQVKVIDNKWEMRGLVEGVEMGTGDGIRWVECGMEWQWHFWTRLFWCKTVNMRVPWPVSYGENQMQNKKKRKKPIIGMALKNETLGPSWHSLNLNYPRYPDIYIYLLLKNSSFRL
jgi:hypothetical protein